MSYTDRFFEYLQSLPGILIYLFLGLSAFVENIFPPIPGDTITAFGALLVGIGGLSFFGVYFSTTLGSLLGFLFLFQLGAFLGRRFFIKKNIRFFSQKDILRAEKWFGKYGYLIIALNRFFPGIRSAIAVVGGILHLKRIWVGLKRPRHYSDEARWGRARSPTARSMNPAQAAADLYQLALSSS